jgi:hypothetical protein
MGCVQSRKSEKASFYPRKIESSILPLTISRSNNVFDKMSTTSYWSSDSKLKSEEEIKHINEISDRLGI